MFKARTPEAVLLTVPFTGTHFVQGLLQTVSASGDPSSRTYVPDQHWTDSLTSLEWNKVKQTKVLITARNPYLSALRNIKIRLENPIEAKAAEWKTCINSLPELDYFIIDIGCPKENRLEHALNAFRFIGTNPEQYMHLIVPYVENWIPQNESTSIYKTKYLETGELPEGYDWNLLNEAVEWYNKLLTNKA